MEKFKKNYAIISISFTYFFFEITMYQIVQPIGLQKYWIVIPIFVYVISMIYKTFNEKDKIYDISIELLNIFALVIFYLSICNNKVYDFIWKNYSLFSFITLLLSLSTLKIMHDTFNNNMKNNKEDSSSLFNLFYLNASKMHEIAMLIDNKIIKTIEKEHIFEKKNKHNISGYFGKKDVIKNRIGYTKEENFQDKVYENFDVKITKSIMLRKIYETALKSENKELKEGNLVLFKEVELQQSNFDDTVMILNVLKESKLKNQENDNVEVNLNKMLEKVLDDFTLDYTFTCEQGKNYIIQLPYNSLDNFENGYHHNDLQLGKLSLIGIYRGKINFSNRESISSKFLELVENSMNYENLTKSEDMKNSMEVNNQSNPFKIKHTKLKGEYFLLDVIAIIQEINIKDKVESE